MNPPSPSSPEAPPSAEAPSLSGKVIAGRYLVERQLGRGAMGSVFLAHHTALRCPYAIKILHSTLATHEETVKRFIREAQTTAAINHPHVCGSSDFGKLPDGSFYMVMEYLQGRTLRQLTKAEGRLEPARALRITRQMLLALDAAHERGVVHRDLKPENIMLIEQGGEQEFVKIMDFGLASLVSQEEEDEKARLTMTGIVYGTPVYMSPEQVKAVRKLDGRADLYAVGAMLFEMLTGSIPFKGPNVTALLAQHLTEPVESIRARRPDLDLPVRLDPIIQRAMAKKPDERYADAKQFVRALDEVDLSAASIADHTEAAAPTKASAPIAEPLQPLDEGRKRARWIALIAAALVTIAVAGALMIWALGAEDDRLPEEPEARLGALSERANQNLGSSRAAYLEAYPALAAAARFVEAGEHDKAADLLSTLKPEHAERSHLHHWLGRAHFGQGDKSEALKDYERAIELEPDYFYEERFLDDFAWLLTEDDEELTARAKRLITGERLEALTPWLAAQAVSVPNKRRRKALKEYLIESGRYASLPAWQRGTIDLKTATGCVAHAEAIKALAQSNDERALRPLWELDSEPEHGCGKRKRVDCYGCVREDLATALTILEATFPEVERAAAPGEGDAEEREPVEEL